MRIGDLRFAAHMVGIGEVCDAIIATDKSRRGFSHGVAGSSGCLEGLRRELRNAVGLRFATLNFVLPFVLLSCPSLHLVCDFDFAFALTHLSTRGSSHFRCSRAATVPFIRGVIANHSPSVQLSILSFIVCVCLSDDARIVGMLTARFRDLCSRESTATVCLRCAKDFQEEATEVLRAAQPASQTSKVHLQRAITSDMVPAFLSVPFASFTHRSFLVVSALCCEGARVFVHRRENPMHQWAGSFTTCFHLQLSIHCRQDNARTTFVSRPSYTMCVINCHYIPLEVVEVGRTQALTSRQSSSLDLSR
jgi:hypothetical protein